MSNKSILQSNNESLSANNLDLQSLIDQANALPDAGGIELPELSNPANADELFSGKQLIDGDGEVVTGTFTIDNELTTQDNLISQIQTALQGKAAGSGGDNSWKLVADLDYGSLPDSYRLELDDDVNCVLFTLYADFYIAYWAQSGLSFIFYGIDNNTLIVSEVDDNEKALEVALKTDPDHANHLYYMLVYSASE